MFPVADWVPSYFSACVLMAAMPFPTIDPAFASSMEGGGDVAIALSDRPEVRAVMRGLASPSYGMSWAQGENGFIPLTAVSTCRYTPIRSGGPLPPRFETRSMTVFIDSMHRI